MSRDHFVFIIFFSFFIGSGLLGSGTAVSDCKKLDVIRQDTLFDNQILYNGRNWRNLYTNVKEDQFLFSGEFLPASLGISGRTFENIPLRFDIYSDEISIFTNHGSILQLNKEMVDSFNLIFHNTTYHFTRIEEDSVKGLQGYIRVLITGKTSLYAKYKKEIANLAVDNKYDMFYQTHRIYFTKDDVVYSVAGKRELLNLMDDYKVQIRSYIKKNRLRISKKNPESFVPVVRFYNSLMQ